MENVCYAQGEAEDDAEYAGPVESRVLANPFQCSLLGFCYRQG